jgi:mannose-1-phosphate guanylyltransferase/mannose-6-phosphate isomerase
MTLRFAILCGGGGTRLWPASREAQPKQFLPLGAPQSLVVQTLQRLLDGGATQQPQHDVVLISNASMAHRLALELEREHLGYLASNLIAEPARRNTGPAIALAAAVLCNDHAATDDDLLVVLPADHQLGHCAHFVADLQTAAQQAQQLGVIATLGVPPTHPDTGFGYIELDAPPSNAVAYKARRFVEKPDLATAEAYLSSGRFLWNAGIFVLSIATLKQALHRHAPSLASLLACSTGDALQRFATLPAISFDYAVMEHADHVVVVPCRSTWSDVGSWDSVYDLLPKDAEANALSEPNTTVLVDTQGCLVWQQPGSQRRLALVGLSDCCVVDTPDATLVVRRGASQQVKQVVDALHQQACPTLQQPAVELTAWGSISPIVGPNALAAKAPSAWLWTLAPCDTPLRLQLHSSLAAHAWASCLQPETVPAPVLELNHQPVSLPGLMQLDGQLSPHTLTVAPHQHPLQLLWLGQSPHVLAASMATPLLEAKAPQQQHAVGAV